MPQIGDYGSLEFSLVSQIREKCSGRFSMNWAVFPGIGLLLPQGQGFVASCVLKSSSSEQDGLTILLEVSRCHIPLTERCSEKCSPIFDDPKVVDFER